MSTVPEKRAHAGGAPAAIRRGDALLAKSDFAGALAAYRAAVAADRHSAAAHRRLAELCVRVRAPAEGLQASRRLLELEPGSVLAAAVCADHLEALGRLDEAYETTAPLVRAGERDPYLVSVHGRVCGRLQPPRDEALPLLEALAANAGVPPKARVKALWTLVHTLDSLGRYDEAFARARELKALERSAGIGRPPVSWQRLDAAAAAYTPQRMARLPRASHGSRAPIFVLGMLRSGTTLTEQILASHPQVYGAGELPDVAQAAMQALPAREPYPACLEHLTRERLDAIARAYLERLRARAPHAQRYVDKMPTNYDHLGLIELLFPEARIVHCVRDPLDTCLSLYFLPDTSNTETPEAVGDAYLRYRRVMHRWQRIVSLPVYTQRYESLIADPEPQVRRLLEFCGLEWNDACLAFHRNPRHSRNFSYHQVRQPLYASSVGRHRHYERHLEGLKAKLAGADAADAEAARRHEARLLELANRAVDERRPERAAALARAALSHGAEAVVGHFTLGRALSEAGEPQAAIAAYREAERIDASVPQLHNNLGNSLATAGQPVEALEALDKALALKADYPLAHYNRAAVLKTLGRMDESIASLRRALELRPDYPEALNNLGNALKDVERPEESERLLRRAIALRPGFAEALHNLAGVLRERGDVEGAIEYYRRAVDAAPGLADAKYGLALALLTLGRYREAWPWHEARWVWRDFPGRKEQLPGPMWRGEPFRGRRLHLYYEQGMGDTVQFLRYLPMVAERGGEVVVEVQSALGRLCRPLGRWARVMTGAERRAPYDLQCPLQSLPLIFDTSLETLPAGIPYLEADPALVSAWRERIGAAPGLKVGLIWAGNPRQASEAKRGVGLAPCLPLLDLPGVRWFSLQVGERAADLAFAPPGRIADLSPGLTDFAETAAAMANLDLVISTDTAPAHVAGALGAQTWVLLRDQPDWRWHLGRSDCPWYPGVMRLFRQPRPGDWPAVVDEVARALAERVELTSGSTS